MEIRKITNDERVEILKGDIYAYHNHAEWQVDRTENWETRAATEFLATIIPDQNLAVFVEGKVASSLANYDFQQSVRGVIKEMGGIGSVWTYPEYRDRGYVRGLIKAAFEDMQSKHQPVSMLIPFKQSFYEAFGYVTANGNLEVRIPTTSLLASRSKIDGWTFERVDAEAIAEEFLTFMISVAPQQYHGIVLPVHMQRSQWQMRMKDKICVLVKRDQQLVALAIYTIDARMTERKIHVSNFFWRDLEARIQLFSFFGKHRDQIRYVYLDLPFGTNFHQWFGDVMEPYEINMIMPPYMVRVVNVESAIAGLPATKSGEIIIKISDSNCVWNNDIFRLAAEGEKLKISREPDLEPQISATIQGISALVYGTLSLIEIEQRKWLEFLNPTELSKEQRSLLENWFPVLPMYNTFRF
jgi:predicted acetyltransferase